MDLALYGRVLSRFRWLVLGGLTLGILLTILSVARVSSDGLSYRSHEVWRSTSTVLLMEKNGPFAEPSKYSGLTDLYSQLANSDQVRADMLKAGADKTWTIKATPVPPTSNPVAVLPVISLQGEAFTPAEAIKATVLGREAFLSYISEQRGSAGVQVLQNATRPTLIAPRSKTLPIIVFLAMLSATIALAFVLENLRPAAAPQVEAITPRPETMSSAVRSHSSA